MITVTPRPAERDLAPLPPWLTYTPTSVAVGPPEAGNIATAEKGSLPADLYHEARKLLPQ